MKNKLAARAVAAVVFGTLLLVGACLYLLQAHSTALSFVAQLAELNAVQHDRTLLLLDVDTAVRGYVATRDLQFLNIYERAAHDLIADDSAIAHKVDADRNLTAFVSAPPERVLELRRYFRRVVNSVMRGDRAAAVRGLRAGEPFFEADRSAEIAADERLHRELQSRRDANVRYTVRAELLPLAAGLIVILAAGNFLLLMRKLSRMRLSAARAEALEEANRLMTLAEEMVKVGYWRFDLNTHEVHWSDEVYRIHGFDRLHRPTFENVLESYHPDDRPQLLRCVEQARLFGRAYRLEARLIRLDGTLRDVAISGRVEREPDDSIAALFGAIQDITERKAAERERDRLADRIGLATQAAQIGIWECNLADRTLLWDPVMFALYGHSADAFVPSYETWVESLHPDDRPRVEREIAAAVTGGPAFDTEFRAIWRNGEIRHIRALATVAGDGSNRLDRMIGTNWDITELRALTEQLATASERDRVTAATLHERNRLMAMAEEMAHVGHWRIDVAANTVEWSREIYRIVGLPESYRPALTTRLERYHPDDRDLVSERVERTMREGVPLLYEARIANSDGTYRDVSCRGQSERNAEGIIVGVFGILLDITERKAAERERVELLERIRLAADAGNIGIWEWDRSAERIIWDAKMFALHGIAEGAGPLTYEGLRAIMCRSATAAVERGVGDALAQRSPLDVEYRIVHPSGETRYIRAQGSVAYDEADRPVKMLGTCWDVTEVRVLADALLEEKERLAQAKEIAEETSRAKSAFLANMSHEIRTPMNGIIGLTSLLLDGELTLEQRGHVMLLADAGRSLLAIINDILDLSKVEAGKIDLESIVLSPVGLVDGAMSIVRADAAAKRLILRTAVDADVPEWVLGDPTRLRQILLNLLTNAIKFTQRGSVDMLVRRVDGDPDMLRFEVADTGIGVPADRAHLLFENFSQVDGSIARKYGGSGLGLALSKRLSEAMSGTVGMTSDEGVGSVFWFTARLPACAAPAHRSVTTTAVACAARRILVVDDNAVNQLIVSALLAQDGHHTVLAGDGAQGLAALRASAFDLVLMDMQMPIMDGLEATRRIRALDGPSRNVPIVALTANAMAQDAAACREAGMDDHLAKPIDRELLRRAIETWAQPGRSFERAHDGPRASRAATPVKAPADERAFHEHLAALLDMFDGDLRAAADVLNPALEAIAAEAMRIALGADRHDAAMVREAAHRLKGAAGNLYATRLVEIASLVERAAGGVSPAIAPSLLVALVRTVDCVRTDVEAFVKQAAGASSPAPNIGGALAPIGSSHLPAVALDTAFERLGNDAGLYAQAARRFAAQALPAIDRLGAHVRADACIEAAAIAHDLKGVSATVGLASLAAAAAWLETELKGRRAPIDPEAHIDALSSLAVAGIEALEAYVATITARSSCVPAACGAVALHAVPPAALAEIDALLGAANLRAISVCTDLAERLDGADAQRLAPVLDALERLDFAAARAEFERVRADFK